MAGMAVDVGCGVYGTEKNDKRLGIRVYEQQQLNAGFTLRHWSQLLRNHIAATLRPETPRNAGGHKKVGAQ